MYACFFCCNSSYPHSEGPNRSGRVVIGSCDLWQRCKDADNGSCLSLVTSFNFCTSHARTCHRFSTQTHLKNLLLASPFLLKPTEKTTVSPILAPCFDNAKNATTQPQCQFTSNSTMHKTLSAAWKPCFSGTRTKFSRVPRQPQVCQLPVMACERALHACKSC